LKTQSESVSCKRRLTTAGTRIANAISGFLATHTLAGIANLVKSTATGYALRGAGGHAGALIGGRLSVGR
jgi:hypothetical protein